ncbi:MAG TPA: PepSY-associated TM helix domain-containing protein [Methylococcaceae bacterium]|nr:PepSY-associated TM helix domain-containing protein [Methylococcaceae bacterium]
MQSNGSLSIRRETWLKAHRYLALSVGFLFALMGLTGSLNIYREEVDALLNPELVIDEPQGEYLPLDRIMAAVRAAHPDRHDSWTLEMPRSRAGVITAWYDKPRETIREVYAPLMVFVNPYTADVIGSRFWGDTATTWLFDLHTQLQLDRFGRNAVGILGLLLIVSVSTGLYLWWPGLGRIRQSLALRHNAGLIRLSLDLHRAFGFFTAAVLLLLAFTGVHLVYPSVLETLTDSSGMGHDDEGPDIRSTAVPNDRPVSLAEAVLIARGPFPHAELRRVTTPDGETGTYRINLRRHGEANIKHPATMVWVDRWSGQIREVRNPNLFTDGQILLSWMWPLHTGEAVGATGRLFWFLTGLAPFVLYVTGLLQWLYKRGWIPDRELNVTALRPLPQVLARKFYRLAVDFSRLIRVIGLGAMEWGIRVAKWGKQRNPD